MSVSYTHLDVSKRQVLNLEEDNVGAVLLGQQRNINEGDTVNTTGRVVEVPVGDAMLGRVVNRCV